MSEFNKDIAIALVFIIGVWSFISGQFIISTVLFGSAAMYSNIKMMQARFKN